MARLTLRLPIASEYRSDPASLLDLARQAEAAGFGAVSLSEHVVMGPHADRYPWGEFPFAPEAPWCEPLTILASIAAVTSHLELTTGILIAPLRPAVLLAKWAATVDAVSGGRLELGVGTGWQKEEFDALGVEHGRRGRLLTDTIAACRALWSDSPASFNSPSVSFEDVWCDPKPVRPGGPPVLFSGTLTPRNIRRIVTLGDGWIPIMGERRAGIAAGVEELRRRLDDAGRDPASLRVRSTVRVGRADDGTPDIGVTLTRSADLLAAGVTDVDLPYSFFVKDEKTDRHFFKAAAEAIAQADWIGR